MHRSLLLQDGITPFLGSMQKKAAVPVVRKELEASNCSALLPKAINAIKDNIFWLKLEAIQAVLKPIHLHQQASEADRSGISLVIDH